MLSWKEERNGCTALLIKGARRVGKSTIAEEFAKREYETYIIVDFANIPTDIKSLFDDMSDLDYFFLRLQAWKNVILIERKSVIVFDEIQLCPAARQAIKYLVRDGRYDYIETGSLVSIKKNVENILIPSEESRIEMYPMDYEEFRWAIGDNATFPLLSQFYGRRKPLMEVHRTAMRNLRLYMLVGGMPQAINEYIDTNNLAKVDIVKRDIISLYIDDFQKVDISGKAAKLLKAIPSELNKNSLRYKASSILGSSASRSIDGILSDLEDSMVVNFAYHANDPNVGLSLHSDKDKYKMFIGDTGLFVTLALWDKDYTENVIYEKLLSDKLSADLGYVYENLVAQMLVAAGNKLFYYTFPHETSNYSYEVDFIISKGKKICPIEVKSSGYNSHKSLDVFCEKFSSRVAERYVLYTKDLRKDGATVLLPIYMTPFISLNSQK